MDNAAENLPSLLERSHAAAHTQDKNDHSQHTQKEGSLLDRSHAAVHPAHAQAGQGQQQGQEGHGREEEQLAQKRPDESWVQFIARMRQTGNEGNNTNQESNERERGRSLPDEQKERSRDR